MNSIRSKAIPCLTITIILIPISLSTLAIAEWPTGGKVEAKKTGRQPQDEQSDQPIILDPNIAPVERIDNCTLSGCHATEISKSATSRNPATRSTPYS